MHTEPQTIVFVSPRYGLEFVGGAEAFVREYAEELQRRGHAVEVLTTCSNALIHWNNVYPAGVETVNGVTVRRFPTDQGDTMLYDRLITKAVTQPGGLSYREQQQFIEHSIHSQALYTHLREHAEQYRCCVVTPYMFGTTYRVNQIMGRKTIHIPCLHDETFARFAIYHEMLEEAGGILFNAPEEQQLARRLGIRNPWAQVVGLGFAEAQPGDAAAFRQCYGLGDDPFLLYSGRFEVPKNVPLLLEYFQRYKREHPSPLRLALIGRGPVPIPQQPDIVDLGFFRPGTMSDALAAATALVQLSVNESFSIVIMEAWQQGRPVIVHRDCAVTSGHAERSGGGWAVGGYQEFAQALDAMLADPAQANRRGALGRAYVAREYGWDTVVGRLTQALDHVLAPRSLYDDLGQRGVRRAKSFSEARYADQFASLLEQALPSLKAVRADQAEHDTLAELAHVGLLDYRVRSNAPVVGRLIVWLRTQLTAHLKEPYVDALVQRQERFNLAMHERVAELSQRLRHTNQREANRIIREQQQRIAQLEARVTQLESLRYREEKQVEE